MTYNFYPNANGIHWIETGCHIMFGINEQCNSFQFQGNYLDKVFDEI